MYLVVGAQILGRKLEQCCTHVHLKKYFLIKATPYHVIQLTGTEWCLAARASWWAPFRAFNLHGNISKNHLSDVNATL